ncbi:MAG: VOC family protein [Pseudomonadota bacterium]
MPDPDHAPRLSLSHATLTAKQFDAALEFYCDVLGFHITNSGEVPGGTRMAFISQDPDNHHQIALVEAAEAPNRGFVMADHLAFRTSSLDDLRVLRGKLAAAGVDPILPICHGNAWSLYFSDPEGNGLECFVDTPFHVAQPFAHGLDLDQSDEAIAQATQALIEAEPEYQSMADWRAAFAARLD